LLPDLTRGSSVPPLTHGPASNFDPVWIVSQGPGPSAAQPLNRLALNVLHDEEIDAVLLTDVMQNTDIGMPEFRDGARFPLQPLPQRRIRRKTRRKDFDSDRAILTAYRGHGRPPHATCPNGARVSYGPSLMPGAARS
jgi:hypothetical protein